MPLRAFQLEPDPATPALENPCWIVTDVPYACPKPGALHVDAHYSSLDAARIHIELERRWDAPLLSETVAMVERFVMQQQPKGTPEEMADYFEEWRKQF